MKNEKNVIAIVKELENEVEIKYRRSGLLPTILEITHSTKSFVS